MAIRYQSFRGCWYQDATAILLKMMQSMCMISPEVVTSLLPEIELLIYEQEKKRGVRTDGDLDNASKPTKIPPRWGKGCETESRWKGLFFLEQVKFRIEKKQIKLSRPWSTTILKSWSRRLSSTFLVDWWWMPKTVPRPKKRIDFILDVIDSLGHEYKSVDTHDRPIKGVKGIPNKK